MEFQIFEQQADGSWALIGTQAYASVSTCQAALTPAQMAQYPTSATETSTVLPL